MRRGGLVASPWLGPGTARKLVVHGCCSIAAEPVTRLVLAIGGRPMVGRPRCHAGLELAETDAGAAFLQARTELGFVGNGDGPHVCWVCGHVSRRYCAGLACCRRGWKQRAGRLRGRHREAHCGLGSVQQGLSIVLRGLLLLPRRAWMRRHVRPRLTGTGSKGGGKEHTPRTRVLPRGTAVGGCRGQAQDRGVRRL